MTGDLDMIGWCLWTRVLLPLMLPAEINQCHLKMGGLTIRLRFFYSLTQIELSKKNYVDLKDLVFLSELQKGINSMMA